jgi:hypothetical protein
MRKLWLIKSKDFSPTRLSPENANATPLTKTLNILNSSDLLTEVRWEEKVTTDNFLAVSENKFLATNSGLIHQNHCDNKIGPTDNQRTIEPDVPHTYQHQRILVGKLCRTLQLDCTYKQSLSHYRKIFPTILLQKLKRTLTSSVYTGHVELALDLSRRDNPGGNNMSWNIDSLVPLGAHLVIMIIVYGIRNVASPLTTPNIRYKPSLRLFTPSPTPAAQH